MFEKLFKSGRAEVPETEAENITSKYETKLKHTLVYEKLVDLVESLRQEYVESGQSEVVAYLPAKELWFQFQDDLLKGRVDLDQFWPRGDHDEELNSLREAVELMKVKYETIVQSENLEDLKAAIVKINIVPNEQGEMLTADEVSKFIDGYVWEEEHINYLPPAYGIRQRFFELHFKDRVKRTESIEDLQKLVATIKSEANEGNVHLSDNDLLADGVFDAINENEKPSDALVEAMSDRFGFKSKLIEIQKTRL